MLFKYTQPRHQPGHYCFQDISIRKKSWQRKFLSSLQKRKGLLHIAVQQPLSVHEK